MRDRPRPVEWDAAHAPRLHERHAAHGHPQHDQRGARPTATGRAGWGREHGEWRNGHMTARGRATGPDGWLADRPPLGEAVRCATDHGRSSGMRRTHPGSTSGMQRTATHSTTNAVRGQPPLDGRDGAVNTASGGNGHMTARGRATGPDGWPADRPPLGEAVRCATDHGRSSGMRRTHPGSTSGMRRTATHGTTNAVRGQPRLDGRDGAVNTASGGSGHMTARGRATGPDGWLADRPPLGEAVRCAADHGGTGGMRRTHPGSTSGMRCAVNRDWMGAWRRAAVCGGSGRGHVAARGRVGGRDRWLAGRRGGSRGGYSADSTLFFRPARARSMMTFSALRLIMPSMGILTSTVRR
ncbi:hypothetical protein SRB17_10010 [Streptomyces sp. RB17]|nr:hypothetical protein [Streptomyces sp. RB17]